VHARLERLGPWGILALHGLAGSILTVFFTLSIGRDVSRLIVQHTILHPFLFFVVCIVTAVIIMTIKARIRYVFGFLEFMAGLFIALVATEEYGNPIFNLPTDAQMFQILAGLYVIVDGIDNYTRGVMRALPGISWDRVFFFPKTLSD
jgi:hypothetical protein